MSSNNQAPVSQPEEPKRQTLGQLLAIEAKIKKGQPISEQERQLHATAEEAFKSAIKGMQERYEVMIEQLRPALVELPEVLLQFGQWAKGVVEKVGPVIVDLAVAYRDMPPKIQAALLTLGENGWYLDGQLGMPELWELEKLLLNGKLSEVDVILTQHYEGRLSEIESVLIKVLPHRERIFRATLSAHRRGEFELSVPVLLAQADGACLDLTGYPFFMRKAGKPQVAQHIADAALDAFSAAILSPLANVLPINASEGERNRRVEDQGLTSWRELNRHQVLHGESFDYGTQMNSLKAVSLINYLVGFLNKEEDAE